MNRMIRVMAGLLVALGASACVSDPSLDYASDPSMIVADPEAVFITHGTQKQVLVRLVDERNRATPTEFTISNVGAGLTVRVDSTYRMDYLGGEELSWRPIQYQHRLFVNSTAPQGVQSTFTVSSGGISKVVTARVLPANLGTGLSSTTPAIGEVVTITAPANLSFTETAAVAVMNGTVATNAVVTDRTAKTISFVPFPGSTGEVRVTGVTLDYAPTLASRTLQTTNTVTVPAIPTSPSLSTTAPALGAPVTVTAGAGQNFSSTAGVTFTPGGAAVVTARTATTLTILPRPGSGGAGTVTGVILTDGEAEVLGTFTRTTSNGFTTPVPAVTNIPGTFSNAAPAAGVPVTFSAPGFKFLPNVQMRFGTRQAAITAVSADSSTITVLPPIGVSGVATVTNSALEFLVAVPLAAIPSTGTLTTPGSYAAPAVAHTNPIGDDPDPASPVISVAAGGGAGLFDGGVWTGADAFDGGGPNRWYKVTVTGATRTRPVTVDWAANPADLDFFMTNSAISAYVGSSSATATGNHPESQSISLPAASYWLILVNWGHSGDPDWVYILIQ